MWDPSNYVPSPLQKSDLWYMDPYPPSIIDYVTRPSHHQSMAFGIISKKDPDSGTVIFICSILLINYIHGPQKHVIIIFFFNRQKIPDGQSHKETFINYADKQGGGLVKCQQYYISLCSKLINEERGGQEFSKFSQRSL